MASLMTFSALNWSLGFRLTNPPPHLTPELPPQPRTSAMRIHIGLYCLASRWCPHSTEHVRLQDVANRAVTLIGGVCVPVIPRVTRDAALSATSHVVLVFTVFGLLLLHV